VCKRSPPVGCAVSVDGENFSVPLRGESFAVFAYDARDEGRVALKFSCSGCCDVKWLDGILL